MFLTTILTFLAQTPTLDLTNFGAAGVMGAMWLWERRTSRLREQQLDDAHQRILADRVQLDQLVTLVRQNTEALTRLAEQMRKCAMFPQNERSAT